MDKLFDLMTMTVKYQILSIVMAEQVFTVTINHLIGIRNLLPNDAEVHEQIEHAYTMVMLPLLLPLCCHSLPHFPGWQWASYWFLQWNPLIMRDRTVAIYCQPVKCTILVAMCYYFGFCYHFWQASSFSSTPHTGLAKPTNGTYIELGCSNTSRLPKY